MMPMTCKHSLGANTTMKQSGADYDERNKLRLRRQPSLSQPQSDRIVRREDEDEGSSIDQKSAAALFNESTHTIYSYTTYDPSETIPIPSSVSVLDVNHSRVSPLGNDSPMAAFFANLNRRLRSGFSFTPSAAGNNDSFQGNQSHARDTSMAHRPPPPPPPPRSTSLALGSGKNRSELIDPSSTSKDPAHKWRSSDGSYGADATEAEEGNVRRMPRMMLERSDRSTAEGSVSSSEYSPDSFTLSSKHENDELKMNFDESSITMSDFQHGSGKVHPSSMTILTRSFIPSSKNKSDELGMNFDESSITMSVRSGKINPSSMTILTRSKSDELGMNFDESSITMSVRSEQINSSSMTIHRPVRVSEFEDKPPSLLSSVPQNCDKRGRCKLHPQYKLYQKKFLGRYEFIRNCPMCNASSPYDPKSQDRNLTISGDYNYNSAPATRSRTPSPDIGRNLHASNNVSRLKSLTSALKHIRGAPPAHTPSLRRHPSSQLTDEEHRMDKVAGLEKDIRVLDKGERGSSNDKTPKMVTFALSDEASSQQKKKNLRSTFVRQTDGSLPQSSKKEAEARTRTTTRKTSFSRSGSGTSGNSTTLNHQTMGSIPSEGSRDRRVHRLLYTTPLGESGWYSGEVDLEGKPHGFGRMRFKTGHTYEGEWSHGYSEVHRENLARMKSGFGSNKAPWKQSELVPSVRAASSSRTSAPVGRVNTPDAAQLMPSPDTRYQYPPPPHPGYLPAQMQQQQAQMQQQQTAWMNMSPQERQRSMTEWYAIWLSDSGYRPK